MGTDVDFITEFQNRIEPIVLEKDETCKYVNICPYSKLNCYGNSLNRHWQFICDINKLRNLNWKF